MSANMRHEPWRWRSVFFFFQAEDGIRDYKVTGVQTCALPICAAVAVNGSLREETHFFKSSVAFVVVEIFDHRIVGHEQIDVAVAIIVRDGDAETFARFREADFLRNLSKVPVAVIVINKRGDGLKNVGMTVGAE